MSEYPINNIQHVEKDKIVYCNNNGDIIEICLKQCHENWKNEKKSNFITWLLRREWTYPKYVGIRELLVHKPYYQFWDTSKTKFVYSGRTQRDKKYELCSAIEHQLRKFGWCTIDMC